MSLWQFEDGVYSSRTTASPVRSPGNKPVGSRAIKALLAEWRAAIREAVGGDEDDARYPDDEVLEAVCGKPELGDDYYSGCEWFSAWLVNRKGWTWEPCSRMSIGDYGSDTFGGGE